jgi:S-adenosylmethionine-diacylglycerol 3-amino-3-carboxypropyl transferase
MDTFAQVATNDPIIRYAQVWEDCRLLGRALAIGPGDDVLSIGSAGDNVLTLLLDGPRRVTAIDLNPAQAALVELKRAALRTLGYDEWVALVGARNGYDRLALYARLRNQLPTSARAFWDGRPETLAAGVMHCGRLERYFHGFQRQHLRRLVPAAVVDSLLDQDDREAQTALFDRWFERDELRAVFAAYFGRDMLALQGRDASQLRYVGDVDIPAMLWARFRHVCTALPTRGNFYLEYFLTSRFRDLDLGPPYLRPEAFAPLGRLVDRVEVVTEELGAHLERAGAGTYSRANLSDLFEYLSPDDAAALFAKLARALRPGGRIAFWNLFVPRSPAPSPAWRAHPATAAALWREDRAFFYSAFHLEEVVSVSSPECRR